MGEIKYEDIALMNMSLLKADNENLRANAELLQEENTNLHAAVKALEADKAKCARQIISLRKTLRDVEALVEKATIKFMRKFIKEQTEEILYGTSKKIPLGIIHAKDAFKETKS